MKENNIKYVFWTIWFIAVATCMFFIVFRSTWFIGDDAMIIMHTGFGRAFRPSDSIFPENGRFFPLAYSIYDILLLFSDGQISAEAHYIINAVCFLVFSYCITKCSLTVITESNEVLKYGVAFLFFIMCAGRVLSQFLECYSTIWVDYTLIAIFVWAYISFHRTHRWTSAFLAVLSINWFVYCLEINFIIPFVLGIAGLLLHGKEHKETSFSICLLTSGLIFLIIYGFTVFPMIESAYDASHGEGVSFLTNAAKMFWAQKVLVVSIIFGGIRFTHLLKRDTCFNFYDCMFLAALGYFCGGCILRLNWTLYYSISSILVAPALLYYSLCFCKDICTVVLFLALAFFYGIKAPMSITMNQHSRTYIKTELVNLLNKAENGQGLVWYAPNTEDCYETVLRQWRHESVSANIAWLKGDPSYTIPISTVFDEDKRIWLYPVENTILFPNDNQLRKNGIQVFNAGDILGYEFNKE